MNDYRVYEVRISCIVAVPEYGDRESGRPTSSPADRAWLEQLSEVFGDAEVSAAEVSELQLAGPGPSGPVPADPPCEICGSPDEPAECIYPDKHWRSDYRYPKP